MIIEKCPHCNASHVQTQDRFVEAFAEGEPNGNTWDVVRCQNPNCRRLILVIKQALAIETIYPPASYELDAEVVTNNDIRDEFREAGLCLSAGCFKASVVMSRRVLQRCLKEQGCLEHNLVDQIDSAMKSNILRKPLQKIATEIRQYGNLGAHPDDNPLADVDKDKASKILGFSRLIIEEFYEIPATAEKLENDRKSPKPSGAP